jgi:hypothetical protein
MIPETLPSASGTVLAMSSICICWAERMLIELGVSIERLDVLVAVTVILSSSCVLSGLS